MSFFKILPFSPQPQINFKIFINEGTSYYSPFRLKLKYDILLSLFKFDQDQ